MKKQFLTPENVLILMLGLSLFLGYVAIFLIILVRLICFFCGWNSPI